MEEKGFYVQKIRELKEDVSKKEKEFLREKGALEAEIRG